MLDRELLTLFDDHFFKVDANPEENVKSFIELLWTLRVIFDEHCIKWVDQVEDDVHLISSISVSSSSGKSYMSRSRETDSHRGFSLLQSMLYHSQEITTQYWLTPLLLFIYKNPTCKADCYFEYLRHLENHLLGSAANESLVKRTRSFMDNPWQYRDLIHENELNDAKGTKFAHYWFYKLEFVLWHQKKRETDAWRTFRFTAKNSIEHISPQTPTDRDDNRVDSSFLNCFGNLALVSRSINSEYGNLPYNEKRQRFLNNKNKGRLDSLKMDLIYMNEHWNDEKASDHKKAMIECLNTYCNATPKSLEFMPEQEQPCIDP